jgi:hypothetical protein
MNTTSDPDRRVPSVSIKGKKTPYQAPVLQVYGAVNPAGSVGSGRDMASQMMRSDRTIKENIVRIGTHADGFGLYLFDYKPEFRELAGFGRQFGMMADEVETVLPQAVVTDPKGYKVVDYALLGIDIAERSIH